jgi:glycosyltransferase involved in cell wall biosynthesis
MGVRLYGRMTGYSSQAVVSIGFERGLRELGLLEGVVDTGRLPDLDDAPTPGALARSAIFTGAPSDVFRMMQHARHEQRYGMLVPNSDQIPPNVLKLYEQCCTTILTPSVWAAEQIKQHTNHRVVVVPHGVHSEYRVIPERRKEVEQAYREGWWTVLHASTSDRQRKGTVELIRAWDLAEIPKGQARLVLLLDAEAHAALRRALEFMKLTIPEGVLLTVRQGFGRDPEQMQKYLSVFHAVCQPSRGEGFGLIPLEARACGVPVIATSCTGHSEHLAGTGMDDGVVIVGHGELAPIDDLPHAKGPTVSPIDLAQALETAFHQWVQLEEAAMSAATTVQNRWGWARQLRGIKEELAA